MVSLNNRFPFRRLGWLPALVCGLALNLFAGEHAPDLQPDFGPWAVFPGMPVDANSLRTWDESDHVQTDAAAYLVYTSNSNLRRVSKREDTYARLRGRFHTFTAPGDSFLHLGMGGEASRIQFAKHDELSDNEFSGNLYLRIIGDSFNFKANYTGGLRIVPDEDHFSMQYSSYSDKRVVHDADFAFNLGGSLFGLSVTDNLRAVTYSDVAAGSADFIASDLIVRLGTGFHSEGDTVADMTREIFPFWQRGMLRRGRFDARPIPRFYDSPLEPYLFGYMGNVHLLHPDSITGIVIDPTIALAWGLGLQYRSADFFALRAEAGPMRIELQGDNSIDSPGWQTIFWNLRTVMSPWDAIEVHLETHSRLSELRGAAYAQDVNMCLGVNYFINRNLTTGCEYTYLGMLASRHSLSRNGDRFLLHADWRIDENWAADFRIETRKRKSNGFKDQFNFNDTRVVFGMVYKF